MSFLPAMSISVMKIVIATGKATAVILAVMPRAMKAIPSSFMSLLKDAFRPKSVLNILRSQ